MMIYAARLLLTASLMLAGTTPARAGCPLDGPIESATATMTTVTINGQPFMVRGATARAMFAATLAECDASSSAVQSFVDWRSMRRATNWTGVGGALCFWPLLGGTVYTAIEAKSRRDAMLAALQNS